MNTALGVEIKPQEKSQWCYAAVSQAILSYYGIEQTQTEIAKSYETKSKSEPKDCPQDPYDILDKYGVFDGADGPIFKNNDDKAYISAIIEAINDDTPVIAKLSEGGGVFHYVILNGYRKEQGKTARTSKIFFQILDPEGATTREVPALDFLSNKSVFQGVVYTKPPEKKGGKTRRRKVSSHYNGTAHRRKTAKSSTRKTRKRSS
jgi:hypothetical protein